MAIVKSLFVTCAIVVIVAGSAAAQEPAAGRVEALIHQAVARFQQPQSDVQPQVPANEPSSTAPATPLTLDQAVQMALDNNLDIAARRLNAQTFDYALAAARAAYRPSVSALVGDYRTTAVPNTLLTGGNQVNSHTVTFNGALTQSMENGGGNLAIAWSNNRLNSNSSFSTYDPAYNTVVVAQYTQPILRGLHFDAARQQIAASNINRSMSDVRVKATVANTVAAVRSAYWDLVLAVESIDVARTSVGLAHQLVEEDRKRVQAGTMTPLDLITAESQESNDAHALVVAQGNARTAELALKRLLVTGPDDPLWQRTITPTEQPNTQPSTLDLEGALRRALNERDDIAQARQQAAANESTLAYLRDQIRPQADVVANYNLSGLGGAKIIRATSGDFNPFAAPIIAKTNGGFPSAVSNLGTFDYPTWGVAVTLTYPLGYSAAKAEAARAEIQMKEVATQTRQLEVQVVNDVTSAAIQVRNTFDEIATTRQASEMAVRRLDAEQKKFGVGLSTNYLVVQAQRDLTDARRAVLQAEIAYQKALVDFDRAQQTGLQSTGVAVVSPIISNPATGSGRPASLAPSGSAF